jgi:hypothetical protein
MTVSSTTVKNSYSGNGSTTVFAYTYRIFADSDLQVIIRSAAGTETTKTITTHYTVAGAGDANGGSVTFTVGNVPTATETVVLRREVPQTQAIDYIANDPFPAESHEEGLDRATMNIQQLQEEVDRSIKLSRTNTMTSTEFTVDAADRANKILAFDATGEISVTQELGTFKGSDTTTTTAAYVARDIIKSTTAGQLNNVYICTAASVIGDALTDTDHFALLVDAYSAASSATAAAASAVDAQSSEDDAAADLVLTNADVVLTHADVVLTNADVVLTHADVVLTNADVVSTHADVAAAAAIFDLFDDSYLGAKASDPSLDNDGNALQDGALYFDTTDDVMKVYDLATTTWLRLTPTVINQNNINTVAGIEADITAVANDAIDIGTVATDLAGSNNIGTVSGSIANVNNVGGSIANVNTVATNIASVNNFGEVYRISSTAPTTSLTSGDLYFDTTTNILNVYGASGWQNAGSSVNGTSDRYNYTATASQTTFTGVDNNGNTLAYDAGFIDVYLNGVKLLNGTDVTVSSGTSVVLATGATLNDVVDIVAYGTFTVASLNADNLTSGTVPTARVSGAYTGITQTGTLTTFSSTGIDDDGTSTAITINSSNNVALAGNIGLGGATPTTSGTGITFPATASASTNANTLDDYEEGTWTPVITAQTGTITSYSAEGKYTKIGDLAYVWIYYNISDVGTGADNCFISGFPFTAKTTTSNIPFTGVGRNSSNNTGVIQIDGNATAGLVALYNGGLSLNIMATGMSWRFSLTYLTN